MESRCLCFLLLLCGHVLCTPEPKFMLLVPTVLHGGTSEQACVVFLNLNETISLSVVLESEAGNATLIQKVIKDPNAFQCTPFQVANQGASEVAYITLHGKGDSLEFRGKRSVLLQPLKNLVFVQTDKHIYKPGQTVQFRIVALDEGFLAVNETFPMIYIEDPEHHRLIQWPQVSTGGSFAQLSFALASELLHGAYTVKVQRTGASTVTHEFKVEEYVLPKFEVLVKMQKRITILDEELRIKVCALYTYGKPVAGMINMKVCRRFLGAYYNCGPESEAVCESFTRRADSSGCLSQVVKTKIFQLRRGGYHMQINLHATMTEEGTGVELTGEAFSEVTSTMAKITFVEVESTYHRGIPLFGQVLLEDAQYVPLANETITLFVEEQTLKYVTDLNGHVSFSIDTSNFTSPRIYLRASYGENHLCGNYEWLTPSYPNAHHTASRVATRSQSYLKLKSMPTTMKCNQEELVTAHYILTPEGLGNAEQVKFYYLIMAKGGIARKHSQVIHVEKGVTVSGSISLPLRISYALAPRADVLIITILPNGEAIADKTSIKIEKCFNNKVKLDFSAGEGLPASSISLKLEAAPGSLCALNVVDKSVLLMGQGTELSTEKVYNLLPVQELSGYYHGHYNLEDENDDPCIPAEPILVNAVLYAPSVPDDSNNVYQVLKAIGLKAMTNAQVRAPILCHFLGYAESDVDEAMVEYESFSPQFDAYSSTQQSMKETIRKYFPETWLWDVQLVDSTGKKEVLLTIPDTITEWKAGMFCTAKDVGFGLSPTVSLTVLQPFFLELTLPYSVVRSEVFILKATVFNYLSKCIRVRITLQDSEDFHAEHLDGSKDVYCLCANEQKTTLWPVTPKTLGELNFTVSAEAMQEGGLCGNELPMALEQGRKDTVIRPLLVEPEGVEKEVTHNALLCAAGNPVVDTISLKLPQNVVEGSARAYYTLLGDLLGTAMQNLDKLLQMPFGCGEQNMVLFTPNIYIMEYLNKTGQLTEEIQSKATGYLRSGYQRQLTYMHEEGSYSAFGPQYGHGNTWLTAFVLKSFSKASSHIYIDPQQLSKSLEWLSGHQKENGCFQSVGQLFNNAMKGGVDDEVTLSAYITIALLEYPLPISHPTVRNALFCLETAATNLNNVYVKALMAYAFALAGSDYQVEKLLMSLEAEAITDDDGSVHWERSKEPHKDTDPYLSYQRAPSAEVEMTSYALLALLSKSRVSMEELTKASKVVKWITKQQNPNGGFSSTQDTVVALQSLATYGAATYTKNGESLVIVRSSDTFQREFHVNEANRLLLQRIQLPEVPAEYSTYLEGNGCIYTQTTLRYNIPHSPGDSPFQLSVNTIPRTCQENSQKMFDIAVNTSYVGKRLVSNMALVDMKMVSGYIPVKSSTTKLRDNPLVRRVEVTANHVIIYLENLTNSTTSLSFSVEQESLVRNLQPATAKVYDYYETDEFATVEYSTPCNKEKQKM
ncbi:alpha-2-macroglobulin-like [Ambystoma mexicanum]|uniref:alpha-2-macroglobulin-like n=1 Tax=Ambystoma mexicanum TaxID=8296 RepID=UPI0037E732D6